MNNDCPRCGQAVTACDNNLECYKNAHIRTISLLTKLTKLAEEWLSDDGMLLGGRTLIRASKEMIKNAGPIYQKPVPSNVGSESCTAD